MLGQEPVVEHAAEQRFVAFVVYQRENWDPPWEMAGTEAVLPRGEQRGVAGTCDVEAHLSGKGWRIGREVLVKKSARVRGNTRLSMPAGCSDARNSCGSSSGRPSKSEEWYTRGAAIFLLLRMRKSREVRRV